MLKLLESWVEVSALIDLLESLNLLTLWLQNNVCFFYLGIGVVTYVHLVALA